MLNGGLLECNLYEILWVWPQGLKIDTHYPIYVQAFKVISLTDPGL